MILPCNSWSWNQDNSFVSRYCVGLM